MHSPTGGAFSVSVVHPTSLGALCLWWCILPLVVHSASGGALCFWWCTLLLQRLRFTLQYPLGSPCMRHAIRLCGQWVLRHYVKGSMQSGEERETLPRYLWGHQVQHCRFLHLQLGLSLQIVKPVVAWNSQILHRKQLCTVSSCFSWDDLSLPISTALPRPNCLRGRWFRLFKRRCKTLINVHFSTLLVFFCNFA